MTQEDFSYMMIFNPAPSIHTKGGAGIQATFAGWKVNFQVGEMKSFPYEAGKALLDRYPWLQLVKDHPANEASLPPLPSGVEGWNPPGWKEEVKEVEESLYTSDKQEEFEPEAKNFINLITCHVCGKSLPSAKGAWLHCKRVHKIERGEFPHYGNTGE